MRGGVDPVHPAMTVLYQPKLKGTYTLFEKGHFLSISPPKKRSPRIGGIFFKDFMIFDVFFQSGDPIEFKGTYRWKVDSRMKSTHQQASHH